MALTGSGTISMDDMRTEFGISGAISMSDLYRGGSEVPANATVTGSVASAETTATTTSFDGSLSGQGSGHYASQALLSSAMTVGGNGDAAASGNIVYSGSGINGDGDNSALVTVTSGGVKVVSADASGLGSGGTISSGTVYKTISGTTTSASTTAATHVTTITSGTSLDIPSDVTSFKFINHITVFKKAKGNGDGTITANIGGGTGNYTSTGAVNTGVPASGTIAFSDLYGAIA